MAHFIIYTAIGPLVGSFRKSSLGKIIFREYDEHTGQVKELWHSDTRSVGKKAMFTNGLDKIAINVPRDIVL